MLKYFQYWTYVPTTFGEMDCRTQKRERERKERGRWCENDWVKPRFDPLALTEKLLGCE